MAKRKTTTDKPFRLSDSQLEGMLRPLFRGRFAFKVLTNSMSPRFEKGEAVATDADMAIGPDDDVVIFLKSGFDVDVSPGGICRRFLEWDGDEIVVKTFTPDRVSRIPLANVAAMLRIFQFGQKDILFQPPAPRV